MIGGLKVSEFYTEAQPITPVSYTTKAPSGYYLECAEDCVMAIGTPERNAELLQQLPRLAAMAGTMFQDQLATQRLKHDDFIKLNPEERYQKLQQSNPDN